MPTSRNRELMGNRNCIPAVNLNPLGPALTASRSRIATGLSEVTKAEPTGDSSICQRGVAAGQHCPRRPRLPNPRVRRFGVLGAICTFGRRTDRETGADALGQGQPVARQVSHGVVVVSGEPGVCQAHRSCTPRVELCARFGSHCGVTEDRCGAAQKTGPKQSPVTTRIYRRVRLVALRVAVYACGTVTPVALLCLREA